MDTKSATLLLQELANVGERFMELKQQVKSLSSVNSVTYEISARNLKTASYVAYYVDAELKNGKGISWWLEIRWDQNFLTTEASVRVVTDIGQDAIVVFPEKSTASLKDFIVNLESNAINLQKSLNIKEVEAVIK